jgi:tripartite-type tricarboxylate transporter receptor subunit TctC
MLKRLGRHIRSVAMATFCIFSFSVPLAVFAQAYPSKPVKLVVPYPPGGPTDIVARVLAQSLSDQLGQQFIIENRAGGGGNPGAEAVARSAPDGYTLLVATTAHAINPSLFGNLSYQLSKDFVPISQLTSGPLLVVVNPALPVTNIQELIALAKAKPGELNFASSGNGQSTHLSVELFNSMAGVKMTHVPYKGSAPGLNDVIAGQTQVMFDTMLTAYPQVKSGKVRALAVTSSARSPAAPDVPTVAESGLSGYEAIAWNGLLAPAGTPSEIILILSKAVFKALAQPDVRQRFEAQGFMPSASTPDVFAVFIKSELDKWGKVVLDSGAKVD